MNAFLLSTIMVFIAEMGDKTQLVALCLAGRYNARVVLAGIFTATLAVHVISVLLGGEIGKFMSPNWVKLISGVAFVGFGLWTIRGDSLGDDECENIQGKSPFWLVVTTFFLAELGDKTMITTMTLAAGHSIWWVWIGSTLGMVLSDGLAIIVGQMLGAKLPEKAVKIGAACIFFAFGAVSMTQGALKLPMSGWISASVSVAVMLAIFMRSQFIRNNLDKAAAASVCK